MRRSIRFIFENFFSRDEKDPAAGFGFADAEFRDEKLGRPRYMLMTDCIDHGFIRVRCAIPPIIVQFVRESITVRMTSCFASLDSVALQVISLLNYYSEDPISTIFL